MEDELEMADSAPKINKKKDKPEVKKILVRASPVEHAHLKEKAKAASLSLNDYLIECGLSIEHCPNPRERELRERAVFEIRKASYNLGRLIKRLCQGNFPIEQIDAAVSEIVQAARVVIQAYGEQSKKDNNANQ